MSGKQKTVTVAVGMVSVSLLNILLLFALTGGTKLGTRSVRFAVTCVLAYCLLRCLTWARWVTGILSAIGVATSLIGILIFWRQSIPLFSIASFWMIALGLFYGWVAYTLLVDRDVNDHFNSPAVF